MENRASDATGFCKLHHYIKLRQKASEFSGWHGSACQRLYNRYKDELEYEAHLPLSENAVCVYNTVYTDLKEQLDKIPHEMDALKCWFEDIRDLAVWGLENM